MFEGIRIVEKFNIAQQLTATLTPSKVSMMYNDDRCFACGQMGHCGCHCPDMQFTAVMNLATLHMTAPTRFLHWEHHTTKTGVIPGHNTMKPKETDYTQPTMGTDMGDISTNHNDATFPTMTEAAAVPDGTHHSPHPATTVAHAALWLMDAPIATQAMTHPTGTVTPHPELSISPTVITHTTIPQTIACLAPETLTALHGDHS